MAVTTKNGMVFVGEFSLPGHPETAIYASPENLAAVKAAYEAIDEDNLRVDVLDDVIAAGGVWLAE